VNRLPRWRLLTALCILGALAFLGIRLTPLYIHNLQLQNYVNDLSVHPDSMARPDESLKAQVLQKAQALQLPVTPDNVRILRTGDRMRIDVRYIVRVDLPCSPCGQVRLPPVRCRGHVPECLDRIEVKTVVDAAIDLLHDARPGRVPALA